MEFITSHIAPFLSRLTVHDGIWALTLVLALALGRLWPTVKAKVAAGWTSIKAVFQKDEARVKAVIELTEQDLQAVTAKVLSITSAEVAGLKTRIAALEKTVTARIDAQVAADAVKVAPMAAPATPPAQAAESVHGWQPPAAQA